MKLTTKIQKIILDQKFPKSNILLPGTNNKLSLNLKIKSEQPESINLPFTNIYILSPLYNKLSESTKIQNISDTITKAAQNKTFGIKIQIRNNGQKI